MYTVHGMEENEVVFSCLYLEFIYAGMEERQKFAVVYKKKKIQDSVFR